MKRRKIVSYIGVIGSGKDYKANKLAMEKNVPVFDFSDGVRDFTFSFLGWEPSNDKEYSDFKGKMFPMVMPGHGLFYITGRKFLENIGKRMREFDPDFWADYTIRQIEEQLMNNPDMDTIIVGSCRYANEAEALFSLTYDGVADVQFIFCDYRSERYESDRDDESEWFAQAFLSQGCKDGQDITDLVLQRCGL